MQNDLNVMIKYKIFQVYLHPNPLKKFFGKIVDRLFLPDCHMFKSHNQSVD